MRRCVLLFFILSALFFWQEWISLALKTAVHIRLGCHLTYHQLRVEKCTIILDDVFLLAPSGSLFGKQIQIAWKPFQKANRLELVLYRPHLVFSEEFHPLLTKRRWLEIAVQIKEGTFEWKYKKDESLIGAFSYANERLSVTVNEGSLAAEFIDANKIHCNFERWPLAPFAERFLSDWMLSGQTHGEIHLVCKNLCVESISGRLVCEGFEIIGEQGKGRAEWIEGEGEWNETAFKRLKINFHDAVFERGISRLEKLQGTFISNRDVGLSWDIEGPSFLWEGKSFCQSRLSNWLDSKLQVGESKALLHIAQLTGGKSLYAVELLGAERRMTELVQSFFPKKWPCQLEEGSVTGRFEWIMDWPEQNIETWNIEEIRATDCKLRSDAFTFTSEELSLAGNNEKTGSLSIVNGHFQGKMFECSDLQGIARIVDGVIEQGSIKGRLHQWEIETHLFGKLIQGIICIDVKGKETAFFEGQFDWSEDLLIFAFPQSRFAEIEFTSSCQWSLKEQFSFIFTVPKLEGRLDYLLNLFDQPIIEGIASGSLCCKGELFTDSSEWQWDADMKLTALCWGAFSDGSTCLTIRSQEDLFEWTHLSGNWKIGDARFPIRGVTLRKQGDAISFDIRLEHRFWEFARLKGMAYTGTQNFSLDFDSDRSHFLGSPLQIQTCKIASCGTIESLKLSQRIPWEAVLAAGPCFMEIDRSLIIPWLLQAPLSGACLIDVDLSSHASSIAVRGEKIYYAHQPVPFSLDVRTGEVWKIEQLQVGGLLIRGSLNPDKSRWKIEQGSIEWNNGLTAVISGYFDETKCDLSIERLSTCCEQLVPDYLSHLNLAGKVEGHGYLSIEWKDHLSYDLDLDLSPTSLQCKGLSIHHMNPVQLHISEAQGILLRGFEFEVCKPELALPWMYGRIGLIQFDFLKKHWILQQAQLHLPADSIALLRSFNIFFNMLDAQHDLECVADIDCAADFSSFSCSMREGFIPVWGEVRHLQNIQVECNGDGVTAVSLQAMHQGHSVNMNTRFQLNPYPVGTLILADEEEQEDPLTIRWELPGEQGLILHSIEGAFGGIDASFYEEIREEDRHSLIGSARLNFDVLAELLPSHLAKVFRQLKMGKGYELKGRIFHENRECSSFAFKGWLSGKSCELFGYQVRTLLAHLEADATKVRFSNIKGSDSAGILKIDELVMQEPSPGVPWHISSPCIKLEEFRPSLLQKPGKEVGPIGPLVVRSLKLTNLQGLLEDSYTYKAQGEMSFINSFKRDYTVFDIPSEVLGRIIGLDLELLIPVRGRMKLELKEGRVWLDDLEDAYSEGRRSKFFLVTEGLSPSVDLDGHINILVKMKQYVLFKITENFLLSIDGTLENPSTHLQKKNKGFGG